MSVPVAFEFRPGRLRNEGLSSDFLTPPSPSNLQEHLEIRRGSIASSQSSMSSISPFTNYGSDYSMSMSPVCSRSPFSDDSFVDVMSQDLSQGIEGQSFHELSCRSRSQLFESEGINYSDWVEVHNPMDQSSGPMQYQQQRDVFSPSFNILQQQFSEPQSTGGGMALSNEMPWNDFVPVSYPHYNHQLDTQLLEQTMDNRNAHAFWTAQMQQAHNFPERTMLSEAPVELNTEFVRSQPEPFVPTNPFDDATLSVPQLPQEVSYERGSPVSVKQEIASSEDEYTTKRSIYVSPTGGKSVKKERRANGVSKRKSNKGRSKARTHSALQSCSEDENEWITGKKVDFKLKGVKLNEHGNLCPHPTGDGKAQVHQCPECTKVFKKPEHLSRHVKTHSGERPFFCEICGRHFGRNDNCEDHVFTHVLQPGKQVKRNSKSNEKLPLHELVSRIKDPKLIDKLHCKFQKAVRALDLERQKRIVSAPLVTRSET